MGKLENLRDSYIKEGLSYEQAQAKTAQDALLDLIAKSALSKHVTIKGGVLMQHISKDSRRATSDFDLDFVRYSINEKSIRQFIKSLNSGNSEFHIEIVGAIDELKHQDYCGKRVHANITDKTNESINTKIDIGVHNLISPNVEEICFDINKLEESVTLLADSCEQMVAEKLRSLLRIGAASTRYKDVFDIYYLLIIKGVNNQALDDALNALVFSDSNMRETTYADLVKRLTTIFSNRRFMSQLSRAKNDWLEISPNKVVNAIIKYFSTL